MTAYYNEHDDFAAAWLRNLIAAGHIAPGDVDTRSIADVHPADTLGYEQCHYFAGIGGWSLALRHAGWPDERPVWTGSCPCQPFSAAGKRQGTKDPRHLWPEFQRLIAERHPAVVFGEQVASKDGRPWLAGIRTDLEALGYAVGAADLCSPCVGEEAWARISYEDNSFKWEKIVLGAPNIRQRLYWVADSGRERGAGRGSVRDMERAPAGNESPREERQWVRNAVGDCGATGGMADASASGRRALQRASQEDWRAQVEPDRHGDVVRLGDADTTRLSTREREAVERAGRREEGRAVGESSRPPDRLEHATRDGREQPERRGSLPGVGRAFGYWSDFDILPCTDGKARRTQSAAQRMVDGLPGSLGQLRPDLKAGIEAEIAAYAAQTGSDPTQVLRNLWAALLSAAKSVRRLGERAMLLEEAVLFAALCQFAEQGWPLAQGAPRESKEASRDAMRVLWRNEAAARPSCERGLDGQQAGEPSNPLHLLSPVLARYAQAAWSDAYQANAAAVFPLAHGVPNRVGLLRGYGNAINPEVAKEFIEAWQECRP